MIPLSTHLALYFTLLHPPSNTTSLLSRISFHHLRPCLKSKTKRMLFVWKTVTWWLRTSVCLTKICGWKTSFLFIYNLQGKVKVTWGFLYHNKASFTLCLTYSGSYSLCLIMMMSSIKWSSCMSSMDWVCSTTSGVAYLTHRCDELICWSLHTRRLHHIFIRLYLTSSDNYSKSCSTMPIFLLQFLWQQVTAILFNTPLNFELCPSLKQFKQKLQQSLVDSHMCWFPSACSRSSL